jgi:hypothetical protein
MIDGMVDNLDRLAVFVGVTVTAFGVRYVGALAAARLSTLTLAGALTTLRAALLRVPFVLLIVAATELILWFGKLVTAAGGWGNALDLLGDIAKGVWTGIKESAKSIVPALGAVWQDIKAGFMSMVSSLVSTWSNFLFQIGASLGGIPGFDEIGGSILDKSSEIDALAASFTRSEMAAKRHADALRAQSATMRDEGFAKAREAVDALRQAMAGVNSETEDTTDAINKLNDALKPLDPGSGGGGGSAVPKLKDEMEKAKTISQQLGEGLAGAFAGSLAQARSLSDFADKLRQSMQRLLQSIAETLFNQAFMQILGNFMPSFGPTLALAGRRSSGGPMRAGSPYLVGESGPEIIVPSQSGTAVANHRMGGGGTVVQIVNNTGQPVRQERTRDPNGREIVRTIVGEEIGRGGFDRQLGGRFGSTPQQVRR